MRYYLTLSFILLAEVFWCQGLGTNPGAIIRIRRLLGQSGQSCEIEGNLKFVGDECKGDSDCFSADDKNSASCKSGRCVCNDEYVAEHLWFAPKDKRMVCVEAPHRNEPCKTICQKPYVCTDANSTTGLKTCQCVSPHVDNEDSCYLECKADEVFEGGECKKRCDNNGNETDCVKKLGDKCNPKSNDDQCPTNAVCSNKKKCECLCGFVQLGNETCARQPICPATRPSKTTITFDDIVDDLALCRLSNKPRTTAASVSTVDRCPQNHYCSAYVAEYGLCCPVPEKPFCPDGAAPGDKCDPKQIDKCGPSARCTSFMNLANDETDPEFGHVCCPEQQVVVVAGN